MRILISGAGLAGSRRPTGRIDMATSRSSSRRLRPCARRVRSRLLRRRLRLAERMGIIDALAARQLFMGSDGGVALWNADGKILAELEVRRDPRGAGRPVPAADARQPRRGRERRRPRRRRDPLRHLDHRNRAVRRRRHGDVRRWVVRGVRLAGRQDGIHSNVRRLTFGPEEDYAVYLGYRFATFFLYGDYERSALWDNYVEPHREIGIYSSDRPDRLVAFLLWADPDDGWIEPADRADRIRSLYDGAGWQTKQVLGELPDGDDLLMDTVTQIRMDTWRNGRVVLVGDAAGCMTLISGQGASMALAGGYVLAEELGATEDWRQALATFEARVKPQMDIRQTKAHDFAKRFVPGTKAAVKAQTALMKLITYHAFSGLLKTQFVGDSFLETAALERLPDSHDDVVGFKLTGKVAATDYATLSLTLDQILAEHDTVGLLIDTTDFAGIEAKALLDDWKVGRNYHDRIHKVAVVGDGLLAKGIAKLASPLYAQAAKHFAAHDVDEAWHWLEQ